MLLAVDRREKEATLSLGMTRQGFQLLLAVPQKLQQPDHVLVPNEYLGLTQ